MATSKDASEASGSAKINPGDEATPGTPGTGENVCPACKGTGKLENAACQNCGGTGVIVTGVAGG